ncbi:hypothetical protein HanRHA438_Chr10g0457141 [Helianthus annuus]|nr:hypothetical protein HanRHA438_Chr10g0457141 [Helianthus annuus]
MDPVLNSIVAKNQACEVENSKIQLHDEHANLNNSFVKQASKDDGDKSVDIISYGAMFSLYKSNLQREFSEEVEVLRRNSRNRSGNSLIKSFLLRERRMELIFVIKERLELVIDAMKLVTLHGIVRIVTNQNREFLRS